MMFFRKCKSKNQSNKKNPRSREQQSPLARPPRRPAEPLLTETTHPDAPPLPAAHRHRGGEVEDFHVGRLWTRIWRNRDHAGRVYYKVSIDRLIEQGREVRLTKSFFPEDMEDIARAAQQARRWLADNTDSRLPNLAQGSPPAAEMSVEVRKHLYAVVIHFWEEAFRDYERAEDRQGHVFESLEVLDRWLDRFPP